MFVNVRSFSFAIDIEANLHLSRVYHFRRRRLNVVAMSGVLLGFGIKPDEVKVMLKDNPAKLMWLD
jgi:hypothetical protein